jgi:hypothetical protein
MFAKFGYDTCASPEYEAGFEKVAIYASPAGEPKHAARQLPTGSWTSKLGLAEDIEHVSFDGLEGEKYGTVQRILRRPRPDWADYR